MQFERYLNSLSNANNDIPKGYMKLKLGMKHDDQRKTGIDYASGIKTSNLLLLQRL